MNDNRPRCRRKRDGGERGFTYIGLLIGVAAMGAALAVTGEVWSTAQQREKERQLLFVGGEFRRAIASYSAQNAAAAAAARYPQRLEDLLRDPRFPGMRRHLRRIYADPVTGTTEWGLLKGRNGEIYGVYSLSDDTPVKQAKFGPDDGPFEGKSKYSEWVFSPVQIVPQKPAPIARTAGSWRQAPQRQ